MFCDVDNAADNNETGNIQYINLNYIEITKYYSLHLRE